MRWYVHTVRKTGHRTRTLRGTKVQELVPSVRMKERTHVHIIRTYIKVRSVYSWYRYVLFDGYDPAGGLVRKKEKT